MKPDKKKPPEVFMIDFTVIKLMLEGNNKQKSVDLLNKLHNLKKRLPENEAPNVFTTTSNFLRGLYDAKKIDLDYLHQFLKTVTIVSIHPVNKFDMMGEQAVMNENIKMLEAMSRPLPKPQGQGG